MAEEWQSTIAKIIRDASGGLQHRDTGNALEEMKRQTEDIEQQEIERPSLSVQLPQDSLTALVRHKLEPAH